MNLKRVLVGLAAVAVCSAAAAYAYGKWFCDECNFGAPGTPVSAFDPSQVAIFIKANNFQIMQSGPFKNQTHRWVPNDTIIVCDGTSCINVVYQAIGAWFPLGPAFPDTKSYKNVGMWQGIELHPVLTRHAPSPSSLHLFAPPPRAYFAPTYRTATVTVGPLVTVSGTTAVQWGGFMGGDGGGSSGPIWFEEN